MLRLLLRDETETEYFSGREWQDDLNFNTSGLRDTSCKEALSVEKKKGTRTMNATYLGSEIL